MTSMSLISKIAAAARRAFGHRQLPPDEQRLREQLLVLQRLTASLTASDLNINNDTIKQANWGAKAPTSYIAVEENDAYTMSVFVVRNSKIPLHDHPQMCGMVKVLMGTIAIRSYSPLPLDGTYKVPRNILDKVSIEQQPLLVPAVFGGEKTYVADSSDVACLENVNNNLHEIEAINGTAAFLDILAPPYNSNDRDCSYFRVIGSAMDKDHDMLISWLLVTDNPQDFWTDRLDYAGPPIVHVENSRSIKKSLPQIL